MPAAVPNVTTYSCGALLDSFAVVVFLFGELGYEKICNGVKKSSGERVNL